MEKEEGIEEELKLAQQMKDDFCKVSNGKHQEAEPEKTAVILHKIGLIYRSRSPDKICLIQSVGLLNAAIFRNPFNVSQIKSDLNDFFRHILIQAKATVQSADLAKKACEMKASVNELRKEVVQHLKSNEMSPRNNSGLIEFQKTKKIVNIMQLNKRISIKYTEIMADLSKFCEKVMGSPPCKYAITGMGSLARNEITPYSDFEHIILLSENKNYAMHLEYFRWYSVIFHTIILNLQETIIPSLNIKSLNDKSSKPLGDWYFDTYSHRGISFDGMMPHACKFPSGRAKSPAKSFQTELIKPVSEMLEYLTSEADLKNGYHLADILTKVCFVYGNEEIFNHFQHGIDTYLRSRSKQERIEAAKQQVKEDLDSFSARFRLAKLKFYNTINIKQFVYRSSTLFILALARIHNISGTSCFDIINKMARAKKITQNAKNKMLFAVAIACEMRLRVYSKNNSQRDIIHLKQNGENIEEFLSIVGSANIINYFQIAYCLQCEVAKQLNFTKLHFYSDPQLINFTIGLAFGINGLSKNFFINDGLKISWNLNEFDFDACIEQLESSMSFDYVTSKKDTAIHTNVLKSLAKHLYSTGIYDEALEFYQQLLANYLMEPNNMDEGEDIAWTYIQIGNCMNKLRQYEEALKMQEKALEIFQKIPQNQAKNRNIAAALNNKGHCLMEMHQFEKALNHLKQSFEIYKNSSRDEEKDGEVALLCNNIGHCMICFHRYDDALIYLQQSLKIRKTISLDERKDGKIALSLNNLGLCLRVMRRYEDALKYFRQSLEIYKNICLDERKDSNIGLLLHNLGCCLKDMYQHEDALNHLQKSLETMKNISLDESKDSDVAGILNTIGLCLMDMHQHDDALVYLKQSFEIYKNTSFDEQKDSHISLTLNNIGNCLKNMHHYDDALINLKQSLEICKNASGDEQRNIDVAMTYTNIGLCLMDLHLHDEALTNLRKTIEIYKNARFDETKDYSVADALSNINLCLIDKHNLEVFSLF